MQKQLIPFAIMALSTLPCLGNEELPIIDKSQQQALESCKAGREAAAQNLKQADITSKWQTIANDMETREKFETCASYMRHSAETITGLADLLQRTIEDLSSQKSSIAEKEKVNLEQQMSIERLQKLVSSLQSENTALKNAKGNLTGTAPSALPKPAARSDATPMRMARPNGGGGIQDLPSLAPAPMSMGSAGGTGVGMSNSAPLARSGSGPGGGGFSGSVGPVAASPGEESRGLGACPVRSSGRPVPMREDHGGSGPWGSWSSGSIMISPAAGSSTNIEAADTVDFGPYRADLQRRIKRSWFPPLGQESRKITVIFHIHSHGEMSDLRILRSSGVAHTDKAALADQAALAAVRNATFRPLPVGAPTVIEVQFTFDYNVFQGGRSF